MSDAKRTQIEVIDHLTDGPRETDAEVRSRRIASALKWSQILIVAAVNLYLLNWAAIDQSWGALGIAIVIGPGANAAMAVCSLIAYGFVSRLLRPDEKSECFWRSLWVPAAGVALDFVVIFGFLDLHGC